MINFNSFSDWLFSKYAIFCGYFSQKVSKASLSSFECKHVEDNKEILEKLFSPAFNNCCEEGRNCFLKIFSNQASIVYSQCQEKVKLMSKEDKEKFALNIFLASIDT